jgi:hypothetical protein
MPARHSLAKRALSPREPRPKAASCAGDDRDRNRHFTPPAPPLPPLVPTYARAIPSLVSAPLPRHTSPRASVALALALPCVLALLATRCASTPAAAVPSAAASGPEVADASTSNWTMPGVPGLKPRAVILLQPPPAGPDASALQPIAPDPTPLVEGSQWVYDLRYDRGDVFLVGVHPVRLPEPRATPRVMGRFALELYSGPTLIERVRFDFPGLGAVDPGSTKTPDGGRAQALHATAKFSLTAKLKTRVGVTFPATTKGTRLELWDRATNHRFPLPWPAVEMTTQPEAVDQEPATRPGE